MPRQVEAEGTTRVLYVSKDGSIEDPSLTIERREEELTKLKRIYIDHREVYQQLLEEIQLKESLDVSQPKRTFNLQAVEQAIVNLQEQLGTAEPHIRERHHLLIEVKEAKGLRSADLTGLSDPFVQLSFKAAERSIRRDRRYKQRFTTYVVEKTLSPKWQNQIFIFNVCVDYHVLDSWSPLMGRLLCVSDPPLSTGRPEILLNTCQDSRF
jgi:hypothetical protein